MEHLRDEFDIGSFRGILLRKLKFQLEQSSLPNSSLWTLDKGSPNQKISFLRGSVNAAIFLVADFGEVSDQSFLGSGCHSLIY